MRELFFTTMSCTLSSRGWRIYKDTVVQHGTVDVVAAQLSVLNRKFERMVEVLSSLIVHVLEFI